MKFWKLLCCRINIKKIKTMQKKNLKKFQKLTQSYLMNRKRGNMMIIENSKNQEDSEAEMEAISDLISTLIPSMQEMYSKTSSEAEILSLVSKTSENSDLTLTLIQIKFLINIAQNLTLKIPSGTMTFLKEWGLQVLCLIIWEVVT